MNPTLRYGSSGASVVLLQTLLNSALPGRPKLDTDGQFGPATHARVIEFQRSKGLVQDGVVGPATWAALAASAKPGGPSGGVLPVPPPVVPGAPPPAPPGMPGSESAARDRIVAFARQQYQEFGWHTNTTVGPTNPRIAGKRCAEPATRKRQGGVQICAIFTATGAPGSNRCLTLSTQAEAMYSRSYSAQERNNTDIVSWCGIFCLYCYMRSGLKLSSWPLKYSIGKPKPGDQLRIRTAGEQVQPGDIGIINPSQGNHHFIVTEVAGDRVSSIDGNAGLLMEIVKKDGQYGVSQVRASGGGFLTPIWEVVL